MVSVALPIRVFVVNVFNFSYPLAPSVVPRLADNDLAMHRVHSNVSMDGLADAFSDASEEMFRMD